MSLQISLITYRKLIPIQLVQSSKGPDTAFTLYFLKIILSISKNKCQKLFSQYVALIYEIIDNPNIKICIQ